MILRRLPPPKVRLRDRHLILREGSRPKVRLRDHEYDERAERARADLIAVDAARRAAAEAAAWRRSNEEEAMLLRGVSSARQQLTGALVSLEVAAAGAAALNGRWRPTLLPS